MTNTGVTDTILLATGAVLGTGYPKMKTAGCLPLGALMLITHCLQLLLVEIPTS